MHLAIEGEFIFCLQVTRKKSSSQRQENWVASAGMGKEDWTGLQTPPVEKSGRVAARCYS